MVKYTGRQKTRIGTVNTNQGRNMSGTAPRSSFAKLTASRSGGNYQTCGPVLYHGNVVKTNTSENSLCLPPAPVGRTLAGGVGVANVPRLSMSSGDSGDYRKSSFEAGNGLTRTGSVFSVTAADAQGNYNFSGNVSVPNGIITGDVVGNLSGNATTATDATNAINAINATNAENAKPGSALETQISDLQTQITNLANKLDSFIKYGDFKQFWGRYDAGSYATSILLDKPANFRWVWELTGEGFTKDWSDYTLANFPTYQFLIAYRSAGQSPP